MDTNPKQNVHKIENQESFIFSQVEDYGKDVEDHLSIKEILLTISGIILAAITVLLPSISILLDRPALDDNDIYNKQILKKDGY